MAGIYIHIPFCKKRCIYCDFYSTTMHQLQGQYIEALKKEIAERSGYADREPVETIYFGGGTPSQLAPDTIDEIIGHIRHIFSITDNPEITIEANPDDLNDNFLEGLRHTDVNRISIGIQTFDDRRLQFLNRRHTAEQAVNAVQRCQDYGYGNISIDLIYGFPEETLGSWTRDIETAISLNVTHISAYHLIYEEGTRLYEMLKRHYVSEISEDLSVEQFTTLMTRLKEAGFEHYEISNFCKPGYCSRHNSSYWLDKKYIGCGPSAHSYNKVNRQWNIADLKQYIDRVMNGRKYYETEELDMHTRYNDYVMTSLRTAWGAKLSTLEQKFGSEMLEYFMKNAEPNIRYGNLIKDNDTIRLSENGIFISDSIMSDLMWTD